MLVARKNLSAVVELLTAEKTIGLDTETTGLRAYHGDRPFSLILATADNSYYFNFQEYPDLAEDWILPRSILREELAPIFASAEKTWFIHNAKFDMAMLASEGVELSGKVYDTAVLARLLDNRRLSYELSELAPLVGMAKSTEVDEHIKKNGLFTWTKSPGKEKRSKQPHYDRVPFAVISRYGESDGAIVRRLGEYLLSELRALGEIIPDGRAHQLVELERDVTRVCFAMERAGIRVDRDYCQRAFDFETAEAAKASADFLAMVDMPLVDSGKALALAFDKVGEEYPRTDKGNPSFTAEVLEGFDSPLAKIVKRFRYHTKRANTYFANFLYFADDAQRLHANIRQGGTETGRFSYSDPNCQNLSKRGEDGSEFPVRRAFVPCSEDHFLVGIDYDQMEYRLLLDYAGETKVMRQILEDGLDVHEATAKTMGTDRTKAKTLNFMLLYGGGASKLAHAIGVPLREAEALKEKYFEALPNVRRFTRGVMERAEVRGFIFTWSGRVLRFPRVVDPRNGKMTRYAYIAPNHIIQGGCSDIVRHAMRACHARLAGTRSKLLLQVHDELLFSVHRDEMDVVPELARLMASAYPHRVLPLTCSVEWSRRSWGDMEPLP